MRYILQFAVLLFLLSSCHKYKAKYPYSLRDFKPELRKNLEQLITNGSLCRGEIDSFHEFNDPQAFTYLEKSATTQELRNIVESEYPILRAYSFRALYYRHDSDINKILLNHLDDTAFIVYCIGERVAEEGYVADFFLDQTRSRQRVLSEDMIDLIVTKHSYLNKAYRLVEDMRKPQEKYYAIIKQMVINPKASQDQREMALYALSKYKRVDDIPFIEEILSRNWRNSNSEYCFSIIGNNPDTAYFKILEKYYAYISKFQDPEARQYVFYAGRFNLAKKFNSFLDAVTSFKNKKSSEMIADILKKDLFPMNLTFRGTDDENYHYKIYTLLKENECPEYSALINKLKPEALAYEKANPSYPLE